MISINKKPQEDKLFVLDKISDSEKQLFFIFDIYENRIIYMNRCFNTIWEQSNEIFINQPQQLLKTIHEDDKEFVKEFLSKILKKEEVKNYKISFKIVVPSGEIKTVSIATYVIERDGKRSFVSGFGEDITEYKKFEKALYEISAKKNSTLEILTHDLAGPLAMIKNLVFQLEHDVQVKNFKDLNMYTGIIKDTCERSIRLITDLVNHEFLTSTNVKMNIDRIDLVEKIGDVIQHYKKSEREILKNFTIKPSKERIFAEVDEIKFIQVINNLISNSMKFTHDHGNIIVSIKEREETILITIEDDGIGIPEKFQSILFERFTNARRPGLRGEETVGLGMSIIKQIVELHKGRIWFESTENKGSTFFVEIPKLMLLQE